MRAVLTRGLCVVALASAVVASGPEAGAAPPEPTLAASIKGHVALFAQGPAGMAWLVDSREAGRCETVTFFDPRTGEETSAKPWTGTGTRCGQMDLIAMVLSGQRAYWQEASGTGLTVYANLVTATAGGVPKRLNVQSIYRGDLPLLVPVSAAGGRVYSASSPDDGAVASIVGWDGLTSRRATGRLPQLRALGAGGGRVAVIETGRRFDCAASPKWSPDGRQIVFSRGGDPLLVSPAPCAGGIWVVDADGSDATQISPTGSAPNWSPNGSKIVFVESNGAIVQTDASGNSREVITTGQDPAFSPDGTKLAFSRGGALYVADADGSDAQRLVASGVQPAWSPDGTRLVFRQQEPTAGLQTVNADGTGSRSIDAGNDWTPAWSPDGTTIAFNSAFPYGTIVAVNPDGSGRRTLHTNSHSPYASPSWAPDSKRLVWAQDDEFGMDTHLGADGAAQDLTGQPPAPGLVKLYAPGGALQRKLAVPDGAESLAISATTLAALVPTASGSELHVLRPVVRTVALTPPPTVDGYGILPPQLSVSGSTIVYHSGTAIYAIDARSGEPRLVARAKSVPVGLSITGRRIAWAENKGTAARVYTLTLPAGA